MSASVRLSDPTVRHSIEDEIERLISLLDLTEPDPDCEPWLAGGAEVVGKNDREGDASDDEPSLGWTVATNQTVALMGGANPVFLDGEFDGGDSPEQPDHY
ncbi:hypothetical protein [Mesorhizobium loti]|uniref:hypothetical protein n=1 Tax=Rhizobium loti TaxID=381 RepID=UPI0004215EFE|nr:hypothetical protein [Mesorhizobium loti]